MKIVTFTTRYLDLTLLPHMYLKYRSEILRQQSVEKHRFSTACV